MYIQATDLRSHAFHYAAEQMAYGFEGTTGLPAPGAEVTDEWLRLAAQECLDGAGYAVGPLAVGHAATDSSASSLCRFLQDEQGNAYAVLTGHNPHERDYGNAMAAVGDRYRDAGIDTPRIFATHNNAAPPLLRAVMVQESTPGVIGFEYVHDQQTATDTARRMGTLLAQMHTVRVDSGYGFFDDRAAADLELRGRHASYRDHIMAGLRPMLDHLVGYGTVDEGQADALHDYFAMARHITELERMPARVLHGDFGLHNVLIDDETQRLSVIDFGEAQAGPAIQDIAAATFPWRFLDKWNTWDDFLTSYEGAGGDLHDTFPQALQVIRLRYAIPHIAASARYWTRANDPAVRQIVFDRCRRDEEQLFRDAERLRIPEF
jgi:aminoglycoside phosphotransferase (APT) family kinase protein